MNERQATRWSLWGRRIGIGLGGLLALIALVAMFFDGNWLRGTIERVLGKATGHPAKIRGNVRLRLLTFTPSIEIERLVIANPNWSEQWSLFSARLIRVSVSLGHLLRGQRLISELVMTAPRVDLARLSDQCPNWKPDTTQVPRVTRASSAVGTPPAVRLPAIRRLIIREGRRRIVDEVRGLRMEASIEAGDAASSQDRNALLISARGVLNHRPFALDATSRTQSNSRFAPLTFTSGRN